MPHNRIKKVFIEVEGQADDTFHDISGLCTTANLFTESEIDEFEPLDGTTRVGGTSPKWTLRIVGSDDDAGSLAKHWKGKEGTLRKFKTRHNPDEDPNATDNVQFEGSVIVQGVNYVGGARDGRRDFDMTLTVDGVPVEVTAPPAP